MAEYRCPCGWGATAPTIDGMLAAGRDHRAAGCSKATAPERPALAVQIPSIPHGPGAPGSAIADDADADYYREAARNIRTRAHVNRAFAGSHLTEAVARLCEAAADALEARTGDEPRTEYSIGHELAEEPGAYFADGDWDESRITSDRTEADQWSAESSSLMHTLQRTAPTPWRLAR